MKIEALQGVLEAMITLGEFPQANAVLARIFALQETLPSADWRKCLLHQCIEEAGNPQRIEWIGRILYAGDIELEKVKQFLLLLHTNAIPSLVLLLGEMKVAKVRLMLCDVLTVLGQRAPELIHAYINDSRWHLIRNLAYIMGKIGNEKSIPYIAKALQHTDYRVRKEAVQALGNIGGQKAIKLLKQAFTDRDSAIRAQAALILGKCGDPTALAVLIDAVRTRTFRRKSQTEIRAIFEGIGFSRSNDALDVLRERLAKRNWFVSRQTNLIRIGAANALAMIGTPEARTLLESGKTARDPSTRYACTQALKSLRRLGAAS